MKKKEARCGGGSGHPSAEMIWPLLSAVMAMSAEVAAVSTLFSVRRVPLSGWNCESPSTCWAKNGMVTLRGTVPQANCRRFSHLPERLYRNRGTVRAVRASGTGGTVNRGGPAESQEKRAVQRVDCPLKPYLHGKTALKRNRGTAAYAPRNAARRYSHPVPLCGSRVTVPAVLRGRRHGFFVLRYLSRTRH